MKIIVSLPFYGPLGLLYAILAAALVPIFTLTFIDVLKTVGVPPAAAMATAAAISLMSLVTSPLNLVIYSMRRRTYVHAIEYIVVFGIPIPQPKVVMREEKSYLAINVGGAIVPTAVATYLLQYTDVKILLSIALASVLTYYSSRVVPGVGVVTPAFAPPLIALFSALLSGGGPVATYVTAVYGTIIGADLLNLGKIMRQMPPLASIGGAGVFDGIYLSGVSAVVLSSLLGDTAAAGGGGTLPYRHSHISLDLNTFLLI